ncbi:Rossmann fold domain-containing protein [Sphingomonas sp. PAMC 26621]|uniref:Rossmann fold domain-containing protein n=1 Tax=Sphingomonas sp. PAMC 26621 TaxID=1112213 RepID=UPI000288AFF0|nr:hypothetical protein [Sphingomonas sp. PAMC 26621]
MIAAVAEALGATATLVVADAQSTPATVIDTVRAAGGGEAVVILLLPAVSAMERAMLLAALGPLAGELAPRRVCAIDVAEAAPTEHVVTAARFLAGARSTTGQVLRID